MEDPRNVYTILIGKPEGKRPLERPRCRREDNIRMNGTGNGVGRCGPDASGGIGTSGGLL
jgi:hypothetical protein